MDVGKDLQRAFDDGYAKAIDEFAERMKDKLFDEKFICNLVGYTTLCGLVDKVAEELRGAE